MSVELAAGVDRKEIAPPAVAHHPVEKLSVGRIGIVLPNWIGDVVMATPALRALRRRYGGRVELVGVMSPLAADVLAGTNFVDDVVLYQRRSPRRSLRLLCVAGQLRRRGLDGLLLFTNSFSSGILGWLARARRRIGYVRYGRGPLLTTRLQPPRRGLTRAPVSAVDYYLNLAYSVGCPVESRRLELAVPDADQVAAERTLHDLAFDAERPLVTLSNGGAYGAAKKWPTGYLVSLARTLVMETEASVLVVCGPGERSEAARIERDVASPRVRSLAAIGPSVGLTKACIARSSVVVSTDSGLRHVAAAFAVPCVTLFGPTDETWSHNDHRGERILRVDVPCAPCGRRVCPLRHHRCLRDLDVVTVFEAVREQLGLVD